MKSLALPARFGSSTETKKRTSRAPIAVMVLGASLMLGHGFVQDYAQALTSPDGLYIPDARHVVPSGTPPGNYSHTFRIYNARPRWISVDAHSNCACTSISWEKTIIPPFIWKNIKVEMKITPDTSSSVSTSFRFSNTSTGYLFATMQTPSS